ncbi:ProQ/FINO family protein [Ramlibacter sp. WS9]|uniref:ProQ/FINO family protein n=1 Tax=Ramlibacter sp. WS9 TaxID=1882741 RepID=UPI0011430526|nr:ProQ/FINO family protein [Ramlibacter sp. WS9]ROZ64423.1 prop effector [Ramlibacter sp. WS9]
MTDSPISDSPPQDAPAPDAPLETAQPEADQPQTAETKGAKAGKAKAARPPRDAAFAVLERLFQLYPKMFGARFLPLKLGVYQELLAAHPEDFKKEDLKVALGLHARSTRYLEAVAAGHKRHDLSGEPVEDVAPEHVHHAIMEVFRRRQARSKEDLRPWVRSRLVVAIEASGLSRDEFTERVNAKDELSIAVLDEAFAELAEQTAKREAVRRAYEASGKTPEEFADMYGMDLKVVKAALKSR